MSLEFPLHKARRVQVKAYLIGAYINASKAILLRGFEVVSCGGHGESFQVTGWSVSQLASGYKISLAITATSHIEIMAERVEVMPLK